MATAVGSGRSSLTPISGGSEARQRRLRALATAVAIGGCVLALRLGYIQVIQHDRLRAQAAAEHWRRSELPSRRGDILDSSGHPLATTVEYQSVYASTTEIADPSRVAAALAPVIGEPEDRLRELLTRRQVAPTLLKRWLDEETATRVQQLSLDGIFLQIEPKRAYPQGPLAAQLVGVVGVDNNGLSGVERQYDADLAGRPGSLVAERDTSGDAISLGPRLFNAPVDGSSLTLTVDRYVQWVAERELDAAIARHDARRGVVVVLEPQTGAVLALAGRPSFTPDAPDLYAPSTIPLYDVPAVTRADEPGSAFGFVALAAALDAGAITPRSTLDHPGYLTIAGSTVRDATPNPPGTETIAQAAARGSNVGFAWAASQVGAARFYQTAQAFGIARATGIDLPGEAAGQLRRATEPDWHPFDLALNAFGRGLAVTPLQLASAMAAVANGGNRLKPHLVRQIDGPTGPRTHLPTPLGRAVRAETAAALTQLLVAAVDDPTGGDAHLARVPGYAVAGLAGLADAPAEEGVGTPARVASFLGFAPGEHPRFVILVRLEQPGEATNAAVAARAFQSICRQVLSYYQTPPSRPIPEDGT